MSYSDGNITVPVDGVYYVYAQVYYAPNNADTCGIMFNINDHHWFGVSGQSYTENVKGFITQYTGQARKLIAGDKLVLKASNPCRFLFASIYNVFGAFLITAELEKTYT